MRFELVFSPEWTFFSGKVFATTTARDHTPKLRPWSVDFLVTTKVRYPSEGPHTSWPIAGDFLNLSII